jgi:replicative DNA helicase
MLMKKPKDGPAPSAPDPRQPPHNIEAEQALLGAILLNNEALDRVRDIVGPAHFFDPLHGRVFEAMQGFIARGRVANPVTLRSLFESEEPLGAITVPIYLGRLASHGTSIINAADYARTVRDAADRRGLIQIAQEMESRAYDAGDETDAQLEDAERSLFALARDGAVATHEHTMRSAFVDVIESVSHAYQRSTGLRGRSTGFKSLDFKLGGLAGSDLIVLAGRPSMGKTALAANIFFNVAKDLAAEWEVEQAKPIEDRERRGEVSFYSLEMSASQLAMRMAAPIVGIPALRMSRGDISEREFTRLAEITGQLSELPVHIDTTGAISLPAMIARARRRKRLHNTQLIVVDYLQLMTSGERDGNRVAEITRITAGLKAMAKELGVPVLALSQLSRKVEERDDRRPQLADLRESGSIEQDADIVMTVYRDEYYLERKIGVREKASAKRGKDQQEDIMSLEAALVDAEDWAEVAILKHRHGPVGTVKMGFESVFTRFYDRGELDPPLGRGRRDASDRAAELKLSGGQS